MATIKAFSDLEQSKKLTEILPLESADMYYHYNTSVVKNYHEDIPKVIQLNNHFVFFYADIPCWSLSALLGVLPKIGAEEPIVSKLYYANEPKERYICEYSLTNMTSEYDNPVDACYELILKLHEFKML